MKTDAFGVETFHGAPFPITSPSPTIDTLVEGWYTFVDHQVILPKVPAIIAASWQRCRARVNPTQQEKLVGLHPEHLFSSQIVSFNLLSIARPVIEDLYQCVKDSSTVIALANGAGCVLDMVGDEDMLNIVDTLGFNKGVLLSEQQAGTNSIALALSERMPVQVKGAEHYLKIMHGLGSAAAPIFDVSGHPLGVICMLTRFEKHHPYALGLVTAAAKAIEGQCQSDVLMTEQNNQLSEINAVLSAISDGILVWNSEGKLIHVNASASQILGVPVQALLGKRVDRLLTFRPALEETIQKRLPLTDVEGSITFEGRLINVILSLRFVLNKENLTRTIVTLRPEKAVRQLVQRQVGANAVLTLDDIPGLSPEMQGVRHLVQLAAPARASILIRGEVGTGKNALASAIHNVSPRRDGPFIIYACASIPSELVVSELLGYDEPPGSKRLGGRPSKFELAEGGTLFFQDVDALPIEAQALLLNVLELGMANRLGSHRPIKVDCRIIASTSAKIENLISQNAFRADLFYRLSTFTLILPPLRERPRDIPLVVERILNRFARLLGYEMAVSPEVMDVLVKYPWPGNVREVEAVLGRAAMQMGKAGIIQLSHLPGSLRFVNQFPGRKQEGNAVASLREVERETIMNTAQLCQGNVTSMAEVLGIGRTTLWRRLKAFEIDPAEYRQRRVKRNATRPK